MKSIAIALGVAGAALLGTAARASEELVPVPMPPNAQVPDADLQAVVKWLLSRK